MAYDCRRGKYADERRGNAVGNHNATCEPYLSDDFYRWTDVERVVLEIRVQGAPEPYAMGRHRTGRDCNSHSCVTKGNNPCKKQGNMVI